MDTFDAYPLDPLPSQKHQTRVQAAHDLQAPAELIPNAHPSRQSQGMRSM